MTMQDVIDEIRLELTGYRLKLEIDDKTLESVVKKAIRELERYWDETTMITVPFASCIDLTNTLLDKDHASSIVKVYRAAGLGTGDIATTMNDPFYAQQWMLFSNGGTMYNLQDYIMNYASWMTLSQIRNTITTDLSFKEDRHNNKLYINNNLTSGSSRITIEYIPKIASVEDIKSDYWIDILIKLSIALAKVVIGRIRTKFSQSNALWGLDGDKMLDEGNNELKELREILRSNSNMIYITN